MVIVIARAGFCALALTPFRVQLHASASYILRIPRKCPLPVEFFTPVIARLELALVNETKTQTTN